MPTETFIFDEVDAGVGGKAAVELGKRLARLARSAQVIVVTHLAQVASWADAQFVVTKEPPDADDDDLGVVTTIAEVSGETRVHEIARMLSGSESEASLGPRPRTPIRFSAYAPAGASWRRRRLRVVEEDGD